MRTPLFALTAALAAACTSPADGYESILPDERLLIDETAFSDALARGVGDPSDYYVMTRDTTRDINGGVGAVLGLVAAITEFDPTWTDAESLALWGPWLDDGVYGQLWVKEEADQSYSWAIELRPEDSDESAWEGVLAGQVAAGATEEASAGWFVMDLTAIAGFDDEATTVGELGCEYDISPELVQATVAFGDISEDGALPTDGAYAYEQTPGVGGAMDLVLEGDINEPPNGVSEVLIVRSRWQSDGQGRADAYVTGGDLGPLTYTETDCWDASHTTVFFENNFELVSDGDPTKCAYSEPEFNE